MQQNKCKHFVIKLLMFISDIISPYMWPIWIGAMIIGAIVGFVFNAALNGMLIGAAIVFVLCLVPTKKK